ncbi:unnamed protein product [Miscanthus lutarioriparius]|uniref:Protein SNOWY COTYLEDON 3 n=1 Tax=Miscanthus lutarioriparius TaxID=422564 RepID=A0A811MNS0_9POAL|nr:unnamed protein product [Miscanthus lutarioriparius]
MATPHPHRRSATEEQENQLPNPRQRSPNPKQDTKTSKTTAKGARRRSGGRPPPPPGAEGPSRSGSWVGESGARGTCIAAGPPRVARSPPSPAAAPARHGGCRGGGHRARSGPPLAPAAHAGARQAQLRRRAEELAALQQARLLEVPVRRRRVPGLLHVVVFLVLVPPLPLRAAHPGVYSSAAALHVAHHHHRVGVGGGGRGRGSIRHCDHDAEPLRVVPGESFFYKTSRAPRASSPSSPAARRGPTPERRKSVSSVPEAENARPSGRWPAAKPKASDPLARSLDCSLDRKDSILAAVHLLRRSMAFDSTTSLSPSDPAVAAAPDLSASSDTDSVSSGSNSGAGDPPRRGISVPARFWQETNSRLRRLPEPGLLLPSSGRRSFSDSPMSPRLPGRSPSPCRGSRGAASPSRGRSGEASPNGHMVQAPANAPSIISFAAEVRRAKRGENRIEEAHRLRLLDNRHLQWRCINARTDATLLVQSFTAEKTLHSAWKEISRLRDNVSTKRSRLQLQKQKLKLFAILRGQMSYLEDWSHIEKHHSSALSAAIKALKASTLRLPVVDGAKADAQAVKEAVNSAVDVMHTTTSSICNLLSKVEGTSSVVSELAKLATQEQMLLDQSKDLLSTVAAIHVKTSSMIILTQFP